MKAFDRETFATSRELEFFTKKELSMQMGHEPAWWPIAILKELIDNALDAAEAAGRPPEIVINVEPDAFSVADNGNGLPASTIASSLDYSKRVSDKAFYVSPTRGQLGNALKCVWAASFVATGASQVEIVTANTKHTINVRLDRIGQEPRIEHVVVDQAASVRNGTFLQVAWAAAASYLDTKADDSYQPPPTVAELLQSYAAFNPHAAFNGETAPDPGWKRWLPSWPTSAHWYTASTLRDLLAALIGAKSELTVRDFVGQFDGLSGTAKRKAVAAAAELTGARLVDLVAGDDVDQDKVSALLVAMQHEARPVKPAALGVLGAEHFKRHLLGLGIEPGSFTYRKFMGSTSADQDIAALPFVLEVAFGIRHDQEGQSCIVGVNSSPCLRSPFASLDRTLGQARVEDEDPVSLLVHVACPRLANTDHGKTALTLPDEIEAALQRCVLKAAQPWTKFKRQCDRARSHERAMARACRRERPRNIKDLAYEVMVAAYDEASSGRTLPADARQMMYAARRMILGNDGDIWKDSATFTQGYLPAFIRERPVLTATWDVVWDARGHLREPHTGERVDLGGIAVRRYVNGWKNRADALGAPALDTSYPTTGPGNRYGAVLFVEKEGFDAILRAARIPERYDVALMSTKGMSTVAARQLVEQLSLAGVRIFVAHDLDVSGFSIMHTLGTDTERFQFEQAPDVVDLGLRLKDVRAMKLESEPVELGPKDPRERLLACGATEDECELLAGEQQWIGNKHVWVGQRVELNAMLGGARALVDWLEAKFRQHKVHKVVPDKDVLANAYRRAWRTAQLQAVIDQESKRLDAAEIVVPKNLKASVARAIKGTAAAWDDAVAELVRGLPLGGASTEPRP